MRLLREVELAAWPLTILGTMLGAVVTWLTPKPDLLSRCLLLACWVACTGMGIVLDAYLKLDIRLGEGERKLDEPSRFDT